MHPINLLKPLLPIHPVSMDYLKSERHFRVTGPLLVTGSLNGVLRRKTKR